MHSYAKRPIKEKEEDEEFSKKRAFEETVQFQKNILRKEFDQMEEEKKIDRKNIVLNNEMNFKNILNNTSAETGKKRIILDKLHDTLTAIQANTIEVPSKRNTESSACNMRPNYSFASSFYKHRVIEPMKIEDEKCHDALKSRIELLKTEIESIKEKIETELINRESILNKYKELEHIKKKMTFNANELNFTKGKTFSYFDNIHTLEFKAKEKKKTSLAHLTQIKKTMDDIKELENKFYRKSLSYVKDEKVEIDKEQTDISRIIVSIDHAKVKLQKTEENLAALNEQEAILNKKRMETFYIQDYIYFFNEIESFFFERTYYPIHEEENDDNFQKDGLGNNPNRINLRLSSSNLKRANSMSPIAKKKKSLSHVKMSLIKIPDFQPNLNERLSIVKKIFDFLKHYPNGLKDLVLRIINLYKELSMKSDSLQKNYEEVCLNKSKKIKELEEFEKQGENLIRKNSFLLKFDNDLLLASQLENEKISSNVGFIQPNKTINMIKPETSKLSLENEATRKFNAEKEKFIFSTFVSLVYSTLRICETIMLIHEKGGKIGVDGDIVKLCKNAMKELVWDQFKKKILINQESLMHKQFQIKDSFALAESNIGVSEHQLYSEYMEHFGRKQNTDIYQNFNRLLKKEHSVAFFLNIDMLKEYFQELKIKYNDDPIHIITNFHSLKDKIFILQHEKIEKCFELYSFVINKLIFANERIKNYLCISVPATSIISPSKNEFIIKVQKHQLSRLKIIGNMGEEGEETFEDEDKRDNSNLETKQSLQMMMMTGAYREEMKDKKLTYEDVENEEKEHLEKERKNIKDIFLRTNRETEIKDKGVRSLKSASHFDKFNELAQKKDVCTEYMKAMVVNKKKKSEIERMDKKESLIEPIISFEHNLQIEKKNKTFNLGIEMRDKLSKVKENKYNNIMKTTKTHERIALENKKFLFSLRQKHQLYSPSSRLPTTSSTKYSKKSTKTEFYIMESFIGPTSSSKASLRRKFLKLEDSFENNANDSILKYDVLFNKTNGW